MQGNGLEKESWAQLPLLVLLGPTLIELSHANNRDASEAPVQDLEGSGMAVSHQKYDIFNGERFPHACCVTLMFMCRRRRRSREEEPLRGWENSPSHGRASRAGFCGFTHLQHYRRSRVEMSFAA